MTLDFTFIKNVLVWTVAWSLLIWFLILFYQQLLKPLWFGLFAGKKIEQCKVIIESTFDEDERVKKLSIYNIDIVRLAYLKAKKPQGVKKDEPISEKATGTGTTDVTAGTGTDHKPRNRKPSKQWGFQTKTFRCDRKTDNGNGKTESDHH